MDIFEVIKKIPIVKIIVISLLLQTLKMFYLQWLQKVHFGYFLVVNLY